MRKFEGEKRVEEPLWIQGGTGGLWVEESEVKGSDAAKMCVPTRMPQDLEAGGYTGNQFHSWKKSSTGFDTYWE